MRGRFLIAHHIDFKSGKSETRDISDPTSQNGASTNLNS